MTKHYFIGVDGGATKCTVLLEDASGNLLGRAVSGPANIRLSVPEAWQSINQALQHILHTSTITLNKSDCQTHVGVGVAGSEISEAYQAFTCYPHKFSSLSVTHDAHVACLGAHGGRDGALIIAGTGVAGYQVEGDTIAKVSGWGFPHDDIGSGAWLGLEAARLTLQCQDGRRPASPLASAVMERFDGSLNRLVAWANQANSTAFATLAPLVIRQSELGDPAALQLIKRAAVSLDAVGAALLQQQSQVKPLPCALTGGVTPFLQPHLGPALQSRLTVSLLPPEAGAILFAKKQLATLKE